MPGVGFEPTRAFAHRILSPVRLPVPPPGHASKARFYSGSLKTGTQGPAARSTCSCSLMALPIPSLPAARWLHGKLPHFPFDRRIPFVHKARVPLLQILLVFLVQRVALSLGQGESAHPMKG